MVYLPNQTLTSGQHDLFVSCSAPNGSTDQNTSNNNQTATFTVVPSGQSVTVEIVTDCYGSEIEWNITEDGGTEILASGGPYPNITGGETYQDEVCLATGLCYVFTITDTYGDGLYGSQWTCTVDGSYSITDENANTLATIQAVNSDFGYEEINSFCVSSNVSYDVGIIQIIYPDGTICNPAVEPQIEIFNYGSEAFSSVDIEYDFGTGIQNTTYNGNLSPGTSAMLTLPAVTLGAGASTLNVSVDNPDGNPDGNAVNNTMSSELYVYDNYQGLPFTEDFESNSFASNDWYLTNSDNDITWEIVTVDGTNPGNKAAKIDFFNYSNGGQRDGFQTAPFDFSLFTNIEMTFEHAFRRYNQESRDSLAILISTDCGASFSYLGSYAEDGSGTFATAYTSTTEFVPAVGDWCMGEVGADCFTIDLDAFSGMSGVVIRFESVNNGIAGNNLFIDNINITGYQSSSTSWNCINGDCSDPGDGSGQYNNESACINACSSVSESWNCVNGDCYNPGDGSGEYDSETWCISECTIITPSYDCLNGECYDPEDGTGEYTSLLACNANCSTTVEETWNCISGDCIDPGDGSGQYDSEGWCMSECHSNAVGNIDAPQKTLIKVVNMIGQEVGQIIFNTPLFFIYDDGSAEKKILFEQF